MENITQNIGEISPLLVGLSEEDIIRFCCKHNNNDWRKRSGYPLKRKGLSKRKKSNRKILMMDETYLLFDENSSSDFISSVKKRGRKYNIPGVGEGKL